MAGDNGAEIVDPEVRGILLALEILGADDSVWPAFAEPCRTSCQKAWQALSALDEPTRARTVAAWREEAGSAVPAGLARLHPSWIEEALAGERAELVAAARRALADGANPEGPARALARLAFARLAALCAGEAGPLARELCALGTDELLSEITSRGARVVGRSLAGAPPALRARAMAAAGEPWARAIAAGTLEAVAKEAQREAATLARAAGGTETGAARERLLAIGLAQLKIELEHEHPGSRLRVAGRLPAPLGRSLAGW